MRKYFLLAVMAVLLVAAGIGYAVDVKTGYTLGTAAPLNVSVGFTPSYVKACSLSSSFCIEWWSDMQVSTDNASTSRGIKYLDNSSFANYRSGVDNTTSTVNTGTVTATFHKYTGSSSAAKGFTIDNNTKVNVLGERIYWMAVR